MTIKYRVPGGEYYDVYRKLSEKPHLLIAGATGSGKSVTVNGIIHAILTTQSPARAQFILIDPKKVELIDYSQLPHTIFYASDPNDITSALQIALKETERRYSFMQARRIKNYPGPILYIIIDELADLMVSLKNETLPLLQRIAQIGRAAQVRIIACSQNIMAQTIPTVLKCNFNTILGLRTATKSQSRYLISETGCERLPDPKTAGTAYGFLRDGADLTKYQLYKWSDADIQKLIDYWTSPGCIVH